MDIERTQLNTVKAIYGKSTSILGSENMKVFPLRSETRQGCPLSPLVCNIILEVIATAIRQRMEREVKGSEGKRREVKGSEGK